MKRNVIWYIKESAYFLMILSGAIIIAYILLDDSVPNINSIKDFCIIYVVSTVVKSISEGLYIDKRRRANYKVR